MTMTLYDEQRRRREHRRRVATLLIGVGISMMLAAGLLVVATLQAGAVSQDCYEAAPLATPYSDPNGLRFPQIEEALWNQPDWDCYYAGSLSSADRGHIRIRFQAADDHPANLAEAWAWSELGPSDQYSAYMEAVGNVYHLRLEMG